MRSIVAVAGGLALGAVLLAWSGLYDVAASRGHWAIVERFLAFGMRNSIALRAMAVTLPPLDRPDLVVLGAGHFHSGCALCHGAPGIAASPVVRQMLPPPPDLSTEMGSWTDEELFRIVKHGIKYTGMPGWVALERDDEVWSVVAFLRQLPAMRADDYRRLAFGEVDRLSLSGTELATIESSLQHAGACARCHGAEGSGPASALVPILHGQPAEFLTTALRAYADGTRRSGIMMPLAIDLDDDDRRRLARYYARLTPPRQQRVDIEKTDIARGRRVAEEGDPSNGIPACITCHGPNALAIYPRLAGQNAAYMAGQLQLWKAGHNATTGGGAIMAPIARRLSDRDITVLASYFAANPAEAAGELRP